MRPFNSQEKKASESSAIDVDRRAHQVVVAKPNGDFKTFTFDHVYDANTRQIDVFDEVARPIVDSVIGGYNGTIFAYGQVWIEQMVVGMEMEMW